MEDKLNLFSKKFKEQVKPFTIMEGENISIDLWQDDFWYDWVKEIKCDDAYNGDGHCYNQLFFDYLEKHFKDINERLDYDSENGMFCVRCKNMEDAKIVANELSKLYKDEQKMISLIRKTKKIHGYQFSPNLRIFF